MNLDPSTHFANELDEFRHIEDQVNKEDEEVLDFTDQDSDVNGQMLDGLNCDNEAQSEQISNQKLHRANDLLDVGDLSGDGLSMSKGDS